MLECWRTRSRTGGRAEGRAGLRWCHGDGAIAEMKAVAGTLAGGGAAALRVAGLGSGLRDVVERSRCCVGNPQKNQDSRVIPNSALSAKLRSAGDASLNFAVAPYPSAEAVKGFFFAFSGHKCAFIQKCTGQPREPGGGPPFFAAWKHLAAWQQLEMRWGGHGKGLPSTGNLVSPVLPSPSSHHEPLMAFLGGV